MEEVKILEMDLAMVGAIKQIACEHKDKVSLGFLSNNRQLFDGYLPITIITRNAATFRKSCFVFVVQRADN